MIVSLQEIATIVGGATPSTRIDAYYSDGDIPWITPKDLSRNSSKYINRGERMITQQGFNSCGVKLLPKNTVLLTTRAPVGYVALAGTEVCTNQGFKSLVCQEEMVDPEYLYYYLTASREKLAAKANGSTFKELSTKDVRALKIDIPSLAEQKEAIRPLCIIDQMREKSVSAMRDLEVLLELIYRQFMHENKDIVVKTDLGSVAGLVSGGTPSTKNETYWYPNEISWYTPAEITKNESIFSFCSESGISKLGLAKSSAKQVPPYSILMTTRATIGALTINTEPCSTNQGVTSFVPMTNIGYQQLYLCLKSNISLIESKGNGSTFKEVYKPELRKIEIEYDPTGTLGNIIAPYFSVLESIAKSIYHLNQIRKLEITRLFSGSYVG